MDDQLNRIWASNKRKDVIVYPHGGETVIYSRQPAGGGRPAVIRETRIDTETRESVRRDLDPSEMDEEEFLRVKELLDEDTREWFRREKNRTYLDVCFDSLEETDLACLPSPEDEAEEAAEREERRRREETGPLRRTAENAYRILDSCLSEKEKRRFLAFYRDGMSARAIAEREKVCHTTVSRSLAVIRKKVQGVTGIEVGRQEPRRRTRRPSGGRAGGGSGSPRGPG